MANSQSALKRVRQTKTRTANNQVLKTRIKNAKKAAREALASGDGAATEAALKTLFSAMDRAVIRGAVHRNASKRIKSDFMARAKA